MKENDILPSQLTTEELEEAVSSILRAALYSSERCLVLKFKNVLAKPRIQRINQKSISENCLKF